MQPLVWMKSFDTGNADIDSQHRSLMDCVSRLAGLISDGKGKEAYDECLKFRRLLDDHFADEEEILRDSRFPRLDDHLILHSETATQFNNVYTSCQETCKHNKAGPCVVEMTASLMHHLLHGDMDFKSFLETKGLSIADR